jgi:hypothetical protein
MTRKRRHRQRQKELYAQAVREGRLVDFKIIPLGAIAADLNEQAPNGSYSPPLYYVDQPFICVDCGADEVWTAAQQKWFYETAKGSIYARAIRCRACRIERRKNHGGTERKT